MNYSPRAAKRQARRLVLEPLEARETPAALLTYTDVDGDDVTVRTSKGTDAMLTAAATIVGGQLQLLDLTDAAFAGTTVSITARRNPTTFGDGNVNVGRIDATGNDLSAVSIDGDLGQIDAGDATIQTPGIKILSVYSMGRFGTTTQAGGGDLISTVVGPISNMAVRGDFMEANLTVNGFIGLLRIGGSVIGGAAAESGRIAATDDMGVVLIGGSIFGGDGDRSGQITSADGIAAVMIGGSVIGGAGERSGRVETTNAAGADMGVVTIKGNLEGNGGDRSGSVATTGNLRLIRVSGSVIGGAGNYDFGVDFGQVSVQGDLGPVIIGGDMVGGALDGSGAVNANGAIKLFMLGGTLVGGAGSFSGGVFAGTTMGLVKVGGDVIGGTGSDSGEIFSQDNMLSVSIGGSLIGGSSDAAGLIQSNGVLGPVRIGRDIIGGSSSDTAEIYSPVEVKSVTVGGSVIGGGGLFSGSIFSDGPMGPVSIGRDLRGGDGVQSGVIESEGNLAGVTIGGSVHSGLGVLSGSIMSDSTLQRVLIRGSVFGTAAVPVQISGRGTINNTTGIGTLTILGSAEFTNVLAGYDDAVAAFGDASIRSVVVLGDWIAGNIVAGVEAGLDLLFGTADDALIAGGGVPVAQIGSIFIRGQLMGTTAGGDNFGFVAEKIGRLRVGSVIYPLTAGVDIFALGATGDFFAREDV